MDSERMQEIITELCLDRVVEPGDEFERKFIAGVKKDIKMVRENGGYIDFTPEFPDPPD